ncbi:hypothetical protein GCM10010384_25750 [Streptomyces djakartensis]|uniref:Uncharacterized protein n=1 Tax=Streptomyces djakartensis TaxID=68193 RepID=A0ABQ2ZJM6_9ACTN|nr:hypothetical protein GCM10010384_25750 [Streptomyces djakartensis]
MSVGIAADAHSLQAELPFLGLRDLTIMDNAVKMVRANKGDTEGGVLHISVDDIGVSLRDRIAYTEVSFPSPLAARPRESVTHRHLRTTIREPVNRQPRRPPPRPGRHPAGGTSSERGAGEASLSRPPRHIRPRRLPHHLMMPALSPTPHTGREVTSARRKSAKPQGSSVRKPAWSSPRGGDSDRASEPEPALLPDPRAARPGRPLP